VGCEGISLVSSPLSVEGALGIVKRVSSRFLIQEALKGVHASVSLLASDGKAVPLTIISTVVSSGSILSLLGFGNPISTGES
ncbi:MAG: hypothetical protein QXK12_02230, partial [Candidatus Nezhaarchaeales archaeon]